MRERNVLTPLADTLNEKTGTPIATLQTSTAYVLGRSIKATVFIADVTSRRK